MALAKGSTVRATLDFVEREAGADAMQRVLSRLPAAQRDAMRMAEPTAELPFARLLELWHAVDAELGADDPGWVERAGAHSIRSQGVQLYAGIVRKPTPLEFLLQPVKLFRLYYHSGDMEVVAQEPGRAVLRLTGFDEPDRLFCRRQTGGLRTALELAGGQDAEARHVRCALDGDAFCEWELVWHD